MKLSESAEIGLVRLQGWYEDVESALVALSGGVDSCLTAYLAKLFITNKHILAVTADSPSLKRTDLEKAKEFCRLHEIPLRVISTQELSDQRYAKNPINRCYFCKTHLYDEMKLIQQELSYQEILNGHNLDDRGDYRPGNRAAAEHDVRSPLNECEISKPDVRELARYFELSVWDKPASPCLSSRIPYGNEVTKHALAQIEQAEKILAAEGFLTCRVRHLGENARIEVPESQIPRLKARFPSILEPFNKIGYKIIEIDHEGFVSGKLNRDIKIDRAH